jgi:hypothetical protein
MSSLEVRAADTHDNEWLSCGPIPLSRISRVFPFDGKVLHKMKGNEIVQSRQSIETYVFDWVDRKWKHNPDTSDMSRFRNEMVGDKRKSRHEDNVDAVLAIVKKHLMQSRNNNAAQGRPSPAENSDVQSEASSA